MNIKLTAALVAGVVSMVPSVASAQMWTPGSEIVGQSVQVNKAHGSLIIHL